MEFIIYFPLSSHPPFLSLRYGDKLLWSGRIRLAFVVKGNAKTEAHILRACTAASFSISLYVNLIERMRPSGGKWAAMGIAVSLKLETTNPILLLFTCVWRWTSWLPSLNLIHKMGYAPQHDANSRANSQAPEFSCPTWNSLRGKSVCFVEHPSCLYKGPFHSRALLRDSVEKWPQEHFNKSIRLSTNSFLIIDNSFLPRTLSQPFSDSSQALIHLRSFRITPTYQEFHILQRAVPKTNQQPHLWLQAQSQSSLSSASHNPHMNSFSKSCPRYPQRCPDYISDPFS